MWRKDSQGNLGSHRFIKLRETWVGFFGFVFWVVFIPVAYSLEVWSALGDSVVVRKSQLISQNVVCTCWGNICNVVAILHWFSLFHILLSCLRTGSVVYTRAKIYWWVHSWLHGSWNGFHQCIYRIVWIVSGPIGNGSCLRSGLTFNDADFEHRGSELNNGRFAVTTSNEECCKLCRETQGMGLNHKLHHSLHQVPEWPCHAFYLL